MGHACRVTSTKATQQCVPVPHTTRGFWCIGWGGRVCARRAEKCFPLCLPVWMPSAPRSSLRLCSRWSQSQHNLSISLQPSPATRASSLPLNSNKSTRTAARRQHEGKKGRATRREGWGPLVSWLGVPSSSSRAWLLGPN